MSETLNVNVGDFSEIKENFKAFLRAQNRFTEYDFEGSNASALLDILSYNTYLNLVYHNLAVNESFRTTSKIRRNVVARAEEVNYIARSFRSAVARIRVTITSGTQRGAIVIPKGTMFTTRVDQRAFTFTTNENQIAYLVPGTAYVYSAEFDVFEGNLVNDTYSFDPNTSLVITNQQVDTNSISVTVIEDSGSTVTPYKLATTALDVNDRSEVFFLHTSVDGRYRIQFGDGVSGKQPKIGSTVIIDYRISSGRLPNGAKVFKAAQTIDGLSSIDVATVSAASSGDVWEDVESIRFNAQRTLTTQERASNSEDFVALIKRNNSDVVDIIASGGETLSPPQYGRVFLSIVSDRYDQLPQSRKQELIQFLKDRSVVEPVIIDPQNIYLAVSTAVTINRKATSIGLSDLETQIVAAIEKYGTDTLGRFSGNLSMSKLSTAIDQAHSAITGNDTSVRLINKLDPNQLATAGYQFTFGNTVSSVNSTDFIFNQTKCFIASNGRDLYIVNRSTGSNVTNTPIGSVDLSTGEVTIQPISLQSKEIINLYATPTSHTIIPSSNMILRIDTNEITVTFN